MKLKKFSYKKVISTNLTAIRLIRVGKSSGFVTSEIQSKGRGQRGNKWISKYGNIFISVFFSINQKISIQNITKKNLNIVKKIIRKYVNKKIEIKRPNDILIEKSKVCGILQETLFKDESKYLRPDDTKKNFTRPDRRKQTCFFLALLRKEKTKTKEYDTKKRISKYKK